VASFHESWITLNQKHCNWRCVSLYGYRVPQIPLKKEHVKLCQKQNASVKFWINWIYSFTDIDPSAWTLLPAGGHDKNYKLILKTQMSQFSPPYTHTLMSIQKLQNQKPNVLTVHWKHSGKTLSAV